MRGYAYQIAMAGLLTNESATYREKEGNMSPCVTHAVPAAFDKVSEMRAHIIAALQHEDEPH